MTQINTKFHPLREATCNSRMQQKHPHPSGVERKKDNHCNPIWIENTSKEWENYLHLATYMTFKAKEVLPLVQDGHKGFYYIKHGKARATYNGPQYHEITLYHLGEGTLAYDITSHMLSETYTVHAITPLEVYFFKSEGFLTEEFAQKHPRLMLSIIHAQALKNTHYMRRLINIAGGNAFSNTCKLMLELSRSHGNSCDIPLGVTHEEIASLLCVRRSWLGKILRRLKDEGVISRCTKSRLVISDMEKLETYAASG